MSNLKAFLEQYEEQRKEFLQNATQAFKETVSELFHKNPALESLDWTQYTPYFNDGDPCVFSVGDLGFMLKSEEDSKDDFRDYDVFSFYDVANVLSGSTPKYNVEIRNRLAELAAKNELDLKSLEEFNETFESSIFADILLDMFGDHASVVATREGFQVDEYDHD